MPKENQSRRSRLYQYVVIAAGLILFAGAAVALKVSSASVRPLWLLGFIPAIVLLGMFPLHFRLPVGLKLTQERLTFTFVDAIVLLIAGWYGMPGAIFAAGIEGFTSSRRTVQRLSSNFFSLSLMSFSAATGSGALLMIWRSSRVGSGADLPPLGILCIGLFLASLLQMVVNTLLLSTLLALRRGRPLLEYWRELLPSAAPMFLPTCTAATILYLAPKLDPLVFGAIAIPLFLTIYVLYRHYKDSIQQRILIMEKGHRETIEALAVTINAKDEVTHDHVLRVQIYAAGLARLLGCTEAEIEALKAGALLHDIGKVAVPDAIINKPGKLTASEFEKMKLHTIAGAQILGRVEFPYPIVPVVRHHHERWDGNGYPDGLKGEDIPLTARILSVVDCFDAVREDRQYRKGMTRDEAIGLLTNGMGTSYDPRVVKTFLAHLPEFEAEIAEHRNQPAPTFGIEPTERLSAAALQVSPAAGLAEERPSSDSPKDRQTPNELADLFRLDLTEVRSGTAGDVLTVFSPRLARSVPHDLCLVTMLSDDGAESVVTHARGLGAEIVEGRRTRSGEGVTGWTITNGRLFANTDPRLDLPASLTDIVSFKTFAVVPLFSGNEPRGALGVYSQEVNAYSEEQLRILEGGATWIEALMFADPDAVKPTTRPPELHVEPVPEDSREETPTLR